MFDHNNRDIISLGRVFRLLSIRTDTFSLYGDGGGRGGDLLNVDAAEVTRASSVRSIGEQLDWPMIGGLMMVAA